MVYTYLRSQKCKTSRNLSPSRDLWLNSKNVLILNGPKTRNVHWSNTNLLELLIVELHKIDRLSLVWILKTTTKPSFIILQKIYFMMNWSIWHGAFFNQFSWKSETKNFLSQKTKKKYLFHKSCRWWQTDEIKLLYFFDILIYLKVLRKHWN